MTKVKVEVYGLGKGGKHEWMIIQCCACYKKLSYANFKDDETFLCEDCFNKWDGEPHQLDPYAIEIDLGGKE